MTSRNSAQSSLYRERNSRRRNSRFHKRRPQKDVNMEEREGTAPPQWHTHYTNVCFRPESEQLPRPAALYVQFFHGNESLSRPHKRPSHPHKRMTRPFKRETRDVPVNETSVDSPSFAQWVSPRPRRYKDHISSSSYPHDQSEQQGGYSSDRSQTSQSLSCDNRKRGNLGSHDGNFRRPFTRRRGSFHDKFSSLNHRDDSKENDLCDPRHVPDMRVKPPPPPPPPPQTIEPLGADGHISFKSPRFSAKKQYPPTKQETSSWIGNRRTTWLRNASISAQHLENAVSADELTPSRDGSFSPHGVTNLQNGDCKTEPEICALAAVNEFPVHKSVDVTTSKTAEDAAQYLVDEKPKSQNSQGFAMDEFRFKVPVKGDDAVHLVMLMKDNKPICRAQCNIPIRLPFKWDISQMVAPSTVDCLHKLARFRMHPASEDSHQKREWGRFMNFLQMYDKIAVAKFKQHEIYILPSDGSELPSDLENGWALSTAKVAYREKEALDPCTGDEHLAAARENVMERAPVPANDPCEGGTCKKARLAASALEAAITNNQRVDAFALKSDASIKGSGSGIGCGAYTSISRCHEVVEESKVDDITSRQPIPVKDAHAQETFARTNPSLLKTLGQSHEGWIFGAIAELVDNAKDANATRLDISMETIYYKKAGSEIPILSIIDDGHGMNHQDICRMVTFGHEQPNGDDPDRIGRFGIGFKSGSMRLGMDALVLTQMAESRSIAFLSQTLNEGKDNVQIPIVSYHRQGQCMELDGKVQSEELAEYNLKLIKEFSPFNEYLIGEKVANFHEKKMGTQIYIWNLQKWGSDYCLEWKTGRPGGSSFYQGDIFIRSRRVRSRPGQTSRKVPLDFSLRAYMEVIFLDPRMKIFVQGSLVKSRPLAKCLGKTLVKAGVIMDKAVHLTLGWCQLEWELGNAGIFLYWHGRLIEAYKRVGGMIHSSDIGRGVLGVIDVSNLMDDGSGRAYVHNTKQGFSDCELYVQLEEWLSKRVDEYWDANFDALQLEKVSARCKPDREWVQCDKCRKWRTLSSGFDSKTLPREWFCYMEPFNGRCDTPEQEVEHGVITVSTQRDGFDSVQNPGKNSQVSVNTSSKPARTTDNASSQTVDAAGRNSRSPSAEAETKTPLKRLKRGLAKKNM